MVAEKIQSFMIIQLNVSFNFLLLIGWFVILMTVKGLYDLEISFLFLFFTFWIYVSRLYKIHSNSNAYTILNLQLFFFFSPFFVITRKNYLKKI